MFSREEVFTVQTEAKKRQNTVFLSVLVVAVIIAAFISNNRTIEARKTEHEEFKAAQHAMEQGFKHPESKFKVPDNSGSTDAPVKLVCYIDSSNESLKANVTALEKLQKVYGNLVSIEYRDTLFEEMKKAAADLQLGSDAAIFINDKRECQTMPDVDTSAGNDNKSVRDFRGAIDSDRFWTCDMYGAINIILDEKNTTVPDEARKMAIRPDNYPANDAHVPLKG